MVYIWCFLAHLRMSYSDHFLQWKDKKYHIYPEYWDSLSTYHTCPKIWEGWLGKAKVSCISHHQGIQLILAHSWTRPVILAAVKDRDGMFLFLLFLHFRSFSCLPWPSLSSPLLSLLSVFSLSLGYDTKWPTRVDVSLNPNSIKNLKFEIVHSATSWCV